MKSLVGMAVVGLLAAVAASAADEKFVWVEPEKANVRAEPRSGAKIVDKVSFGKRLLAVDKTEDWYRIDLGDGKSGYIHEDVVTDDAPGHLWVDVERGTVHKLPRDGAKVVATLERGDMLECDGTRDDWHHVRVDDRRSGWISEKAIDDDPPDTLFVATDKAALHKAPAPDSEIASELRLGNQLDEIGDAGPFKQVRTADGVVGFVFEEAVSDERPEWLFVKVSDAPVTAGPGMASGVLAKLPSGSELLAFDEKDDFFLVMLEDGSPGWLHDDYVIKMGKR